MAPKLTKSQKVLAMFRGIAQIEQEVHDIRGLIQDYFDSFNPHRRWWHRRERITRKADPFE